MGESYLGWLENISARYMDKCYPACSPGKVFEFSKITGGGAPICSSVKQVAPKTWRV